MSVRDMEFHPRITGRAYPVAPCLLSGLEDPLLLAVLVHLRTRELLVTSGQEIVEITSSALASKVCVICSRDKADSFGRTGIEIARSVRSLLYFVSAQAVLVVNDRVVCRLDVALKTCMSLEIKIKVKAVRVLLARTGRQPVVTMFTHTPVMTLSTTVPGRVFPFLSAKRESVAYGLQSSAVSFLNIQQRKIIYRAW